MDTINCFGFSFFNGHYTALSKAVMRLIQTPGFHHGVTLNPEMLVLSDTDPDLKAFMQSADLCIPDGSGILRTVKAKTGASLTRLTGVDTISQLQGRGEFSQYFLGASPEVIQQLKVQLEGKFSPSKPVYYHHGYFAEQEKPYVLEHIQACRPDVIWVGMGFPKQEYIIRWLSEHLDHGVAIGVGGSFDVLSGTKSRAPFWMQRHGMEWLYRLIKEPGRLKRYGFIWPYLIRYHWGSGH